MSTTTYHNPIIPGFAPDPSAIYVENEGVYFLVNSSFHVFPALPIYASTDLRDWKHIGHAINRPGQLSLSNAKTEAFPWGPENHLVAAGGLFAPTIRLHKGIYYVICTNCIKGEGEPDCRNFYVTSTDIWANKWSDPIYFDFQGIDPSLFFDDDGRAYIQGSWRDGPLIDLNCTIRQFEVDIATGKALSETTQIWEGFGGKKDVEGPHIYKKDGFYYLIGAELGTFEEHAITVARSKDIWGPYETAECNPLVTASGKNEYVKNTGHGEIFQGHDGSWWAVCLGVRNENGSYPMGRESFLMPVSWKEGSWPEIEHPQLAFTRNVVQPSQQAKEIKSLDRAGLVFIRDPVLSNYQFTGETIEIVPYNADLSTPTGQMSFVGQRQRAFETAAAVKLHLPSLKSGSKAGLSVYKDEYRHGDIYYNPGCKSIVLAVTLPKEGKIDRSVIAEVKLAPDTEKLELRIQATKEQYEFLFSEGDLSTFSSLGAISTRSMTAYDFTGTIFGVFATSNDVEPSSVTFEKFSVKQIS